MCLCIEYKKPLKNNINQCSFETENKINVCSRVRVSENQTQKRVVFEYKLRKQHQEKKSQAMWWKKRKYIISTSDI